MSKHYSPFYFISQSFKGLWRNSVMSFASIAVLMSMLVVMGGFALLVLNIDQNLEELGLMNDIVVILNNDATDDEIEDVGELLRLMKENGIDRSGTIIGSAEYLASRGETGEPEDPASGNEEPDVGTNTGDDTSNTLPETVAPETGSAGEGETFDGMLEIDTITHVTKAEALASLKEADPELYADLNEENNPLPDEFILSYQNSEKVETITTAVWSINTLIGSETGEGVIKTVKGYEQLVNSINAMKNGVMMVFTWFMIILAVVSLFIIINTVKLSVYSRRNEIMIMRYVGASGTFITLPFIGEGVIIGALSSTLAFFIEKYAYRSVIRFLENDGENGFMQMIRILPFEEVEVPIFLVFLSIGILSGVVGSLISLFKYSKS